LATEGLAVHTNVEQSRKYCVQQARQSGSNFYCAFLTLPPVMFEEMCVLYTFMRLTDDLGDDESRSLIERQLALIQWRKQLQSALDGHPVGDIFPALADVIKRRDIPNEYFFDVIDGVESDLSPRRFQTFAELENYCYQVAGTVGLCCLHIWGFDGTDAAIKKAIDCGTAFQLTNIIRDLKEDYTRNRLYLPIDDLNRFDCTEADFNTPETLTNCRPLIAFEANQAEQFYESSRTIVDHLSEEGRRIQNTMFQIYGTLLSNIRRNNYDVFSKRIRLTTWQKFRIGWSHS